MTIFETEADWLTGLAVNALLLGLAWFAPRKLLTPQGYLHAGLLGVLTWGALGWRGYLLVIVYLLAGVAATRLGFARKQAAGIAEARGGQRGPENVWGSALSGTVCALGAWFWGHDPHLSGLLVTGFVASYATKLSDTWASEVGKAYGRRTFLITSFRAVPPGTEGAISLEGSLAGVAGSLAIALVGLGFGLITPLGVGLCILAALVGTTAESVIGATLQRRWDWLSNEVVNVLNTTIGAVVAIALASRF